MVNITDKEFNQLADYIKDNYGIELCEKKKPLTVGRLSNVLMKLKLKSFSQYYEYIASDTTGEAVNELLNKITTNHTFFMREKEHFFYFRDEVLPVLSKTLKDRDMRIWSAGCSTGEEPFTIAMIMDEYFQEEKIYWDTKILATDISGKVLGIAQKGEYSNDKLSVLPVNWRLSYFKKVDVQKSILIDRIRNDVIYRKFNLAEEVFPFKKKFHVIFCRNVMIYFDDQTRKNLIRKFYDITEPGGFLFIGHSESINREDTKYKYIMPAVYRKE
ncbi:MAG: protein-glutamate O-methyltransferase CheR [Clostridiaceae bacterium]|jgi:chemotaxis protein methyltransferase CheR|nr:protein-glutamate O-methyltransferase CheR [Clostridiaceae bacterium]